MDALSIVHDEVALEGLDGITIPSLWIRLGSRTPSFPLKLDSCTKEFIWRSLINNVDLDFYELPKERVDVELLDRFADINPDTGIQTTTSFSNAKNDVYPVTVVLDDKDGIQGSCLFYKQRKNVTKNVRTEELKQLVCLEEAVKRYGRKLVVVASQKMRFRVLIGEDSDPDLRITDQSYCILERLGRARWQGELQRDLHSSFRTEPGKLHYLRRCLDRHGLITMQSHVIRLPTGQQQHSILLLIKRYHVLRRSKYDILMEHLSNTLQDAPGQIASIITLRELLNVHERTFKHVYNYMLSYKLVQLITLPLEDLNPSAGPCNTKKGTKITVRCLKLLKPYQKKELMVEEDDDENEDGVGVSRKGLPQQDIIMERDLVLQAYHIVVSSGTKGISQSSLQVVMNVGKLEARMLCRRLERDGMIKVSFGPFGRHGEGWHARLFSWDGRLKFQKALLYLPWIRLERSHETYRLLKRKNMIVEVVRSVKIVEGLYALQKMINDNEKLDGSSTKCCKKSILRLIRLLSKEGLVKMFRTTVIQDGVSKKVEFVVHPSVQPNDNMVKSAIEQVRFRISGSYAVARVQQEQAKQGMELSASRHLYCVRVSLSLSIVRGLSRTLGFQPKMHRLRLVHTFLWYVVYGPYQKGSTGTDSPKVSEMCRPILRPEPLHARLAAWEECVGGRTSLCWHRRPAVFADELSWKRYLPPLRVHKEFGYGWALVSDVVLCLPLSIFVQVTQINFKIEGLDEYLNDPVKQHYLVRVLPAQIKRQLLYKRKYIFAFYENLQKLVYMGLLQFGPMEKFQDKDQVFIFIRQHATIVDTTSAEPHYWQVTENPDKPFERRQYQFSTAADVENYWFDLLCVCLNTPLGTTHVVIVMLLQTGRRDEMDDGSTPGDGKGAGGLDSEFFAHLKRNWLWTNYLLACKKVSTPSMSCTCNLLCTGDRIDSNSLRPVVSCDQVGVEPAGRNQQVIGGKRQKRKRTRKEVVKVPRKKRKGKAKTRVPAHDEADHRALKMMTRQRVFWSLQEDSMLMLCGVAAKLLNDKLTRPFVPYCVVRDMLQAELENSMDKTSLAVGRRTRYILKNPQTLLNHRICLAEVYQDKALMDELELKKPDCAQAFSEYTRLLRHKFSSSTVSCDVTLPETKSLLFSRYGVLLTEDIHAIVLHNLIQSTLVMSNSQMKSSRSFQTFHMYSLFNQEVLCQVFIQCRKRGLVNRRRVHKAYGPKKNRALPILPMSYQLSQTYYKCFTWRFPTSLCTDAFRFLRALRDNGTGDAHKITSFYNEHHLDLSDMMHLSLDSPGGMCAAALTLMSLGFGTVWNGSSGEPALCHHHGDHRDTWSYWFNQRIPEVVCATCEKNCWTNHNYNVHHRSCDQTGKTHKLRSKMTLQMANWEMSYISRPWRMVDGSINRLACKGMLEGLLYHVMARPGITQHCLVEHYQNTLQPMAVLDLIQALIDMGCVRRKSVVSRKATLFSRHADPPTEPAAATSGPGATDTWFYEPTISCVLRLAQVLPNEPHWNQYV
uniref:B-block binding subunit of TFIIIC domain-containing protein n=1 Tax=Gadus morhua TaxID=8049 RepID=A0A8C4Z2P4_GADMO